MKYEPHEGIFIEENIRFFREQLNRHPDGYYTDLLPRNDCYAMKNEIQQEEQIPPLEGDENNSGTPGPQLIIMN